MKKKIMTPQNIKITTLILPKNFTPKDYMNWYITLGATGGAS